VAMTGAAMLPNRSDSEQGSFGGGDCLAAVIRIQSGVAKREHFSLETPLVEVCPPSTAAAGEYWRWCPRCGHELHNEKCKLRCPRCHYFLSCSDFD